MFEGTNLFNQNLTSWDVENVENCKDFATNSDLSEENIPNFVNCKL